ncbi:MAG TPA: carboxylesterase family protein [Steroidobacteraceae bacterium]|nr:carboxylesterase family protein [Steroidobacteraceae bacterium]
MKRIAALALLAVLPLHIAHAQVTRAKVTGGEVSGVAEGGISIFKGIPFAAPPVGDLRWKAPAPVKPWTGVRKADAFADACMQAPNTQGNTAPVSEDCLYLNVWTPAKNASAKLPVIVWIHGGGYVGGSTSIPMYDGIGFARKGVVLVSLAYRLGPYGFMAHPDLSRESGKGSGAYGIQDLVTGLEWVRANVGAFGGDPGNVTIFGHSAGAGAVSFLAASPLARGLFHRVIAMSGGSFAPLQTTEQGGFGMSIPSLKLAESTGVAFLARLGARNIAEARKLGAEAIQAATGGGMSFRPAADGHVLSNDLFTLYGQGRFNDTPVLVGHTSDETLSFGGNTSVTPADFEKQVSTQFGANAPAVLGAYPHATDAEAVRATRHVRNDTSFAWNAWTWARQQTRHGKGKVFSYYYDNHGPQAEGSGHGSDVPFAFQTLATRQAPSEQDRALSDTISSYFVNFAVKGDPNADGLPRWPAFNDKDQQVMVFKGTATAQTYPALERVKVFDPYFERLRKDK